MKAKQHNHIGSVIQRIAKQKGISNVELAHRISCSTANVSKIYRKPSIDTDLLFRIAKSLEVPVSVFFENETHIPLVKFRLDEDQFRDVTSSLSDLSELVLLLKILLSLFNKGYSDGG